MNDQAQAEESHHRRHERNYWRLSLLLGALATFGATAAAIAAYFAFLEARRQADAAFFTTRAWIDVQVDGASASINWNGVNGPEFSFHAYGTNIGNSPALNVKVSPHLTFDGPPDLDDVRRICTSDDKLTGFSQTVFMKQTIPSFADTVATGWKDIRDIQKRHHFSPSILMTDIIICANYRIVGDENWHHTGQAYHLVRASDPSFIPIVGTNMKAGTLALMPEIKGNYID